jgi:hypothetical protein
MRREYDIFERFSDGSTIWLMTVFGRFEAERRMQEFAERSENTFYRIGVQLAEYARNERPCWASQSEKTRVAAG